MSKQTIQDIGTIQEHGKHILGVKMTEMASGHINHKANIIIQLIFIFSFSKKLLYFDDAFVPHEVAGNDTIQHIVEMEVILVWGTKCYTFLLSWGYNMIYGGPRGYCSKFIRHNISQEKRNAFTTAVWCSFQEKIFKTRKNNENKKT